MRGSKPIEMLIFLMVTPAVEYGQSTRRRIIVGNIQGEKAKGRCLYPQQLSPPADGRGAASLAIP